MALMQATKGAAANKMGLETSGRIHSIGIAGIEVVRAPDRIRTVIGSCIGIAIYDRVAKIGGLAHIILPDSNQGSGDPGKFADTATDMLIERMVDAGADRKRLVAKITGGASMFGNEPSLGLGERNAQAVHDRLLHHAIRLAASATGGTKGRKMMLDPATGTVYVEIIGKSAEEI